MDGPEPLTYRHSVTLRAKLNMVDHVLLPHGEVDAGTPVTNIILKAKTDRGRWIEQLTTEIGSWRATFRSTYIRWALCINGLHVAAERYSDPAWQRAHSEFTVSSLRVAGRGAVGPAYIAAWDGASASSNHLKVQPMLIAHGIIDLYACLEEWVFALYRGYLNQHPDRLLQGNDFRELRRLRRAAAADPARQPEWLDKWAERLEGWQRNRLYDGLDRVFLAWFGDAGLKTPAEYKHTNERTWAETIRLIAVLRNSLTHGAQTANAELASLCGKPHSLGFDFKEGDPLDLELWHLQAVECFTDQILTAVNVSLAQHADAGT